MTDATLSPDTATPIPETGRIDPDHFVAETVNRYEPLVMRGQMDHWPAVAAGRQSDEAMVAYLARLDSGKPAEVLIGPPEIEGRFFYDAVMRGCNFQKRASPLTGLLQRLLAVRGEASPDALYAGAAGTDEHLPGWQRDNPFGFPIPTAKARIWIGNATHVSTHFDETNNIAVVVSGRRRFTLFPPDQLDNLYVGPLHFTIAGPPVSMVDPTNPDFERYPRYAEARKHAMVADLGPGDAIFVPAIWWHDVQALSPFNVMVNHWWEAPEAASSIDALARTIEAVRDLPPKHRAAWKHWFDRYVFDDDAVHAADHLPDHVRGVAGPPSPARQEFLRAQANRRAKEGRGSGR